MSAVQAGYRHLTKEIAAAAQIELGDSVLKWYDIAPADEPVPGPIRALARGTLRGAADSDAIELDEELGFVILHRCGESFYFLLVSTWRNDCVVSGPTPPSTRPSNASLRPSMPET